MNLLARLMSHGFAVALVALLALVFVYRGELFTESDLPDFLALGSAKSQTITESRDHEPAGKAKSAPLQNDWMASAATTGDRIASDHAVGSVADTGDTPAMAEQVSTESNKAIDAETSGATAETHTDVVSEVDGATQAAVAPEGGSGESDGAVPTHDVIAPVASDNAGRLPSASEVTPVTGDNAGSMPSAPETAPVASGNAGSMPSAPETAPVASGNAGSMPSASETAPVASDSAGSMPSASETAPVASDSAGSMSSASETPPVASESTGGLPSAPEGPAGHAAVAGSSVEPMVDSGSVAQDTVSQAGVNGEASNYQLLASAREAYWLHDYQTAEDLYRRMIMNDPYNPDGYGELANMYFSQGDWEAASSAYYEAGLRLVRSGLLGSARDLVEVIRGLNGSQADALDQEIQAAHASSQ